MKYLPFMLAVLTCSCSDNSITKKQSPTDAASIDRHTRIISDSTNVLEQKVQTIELQYTSFGCACPNWIKTSDATKYEDSGFVKHHIFIEPADASLAFPYSSFQFDKQNIVVTGQFYEREDYPQGTIEMEESLPKAKVFRYTSFKIVNKKR